MNRYRFDYPLIILLITATFAGMAFAESPVSLVEKGNAAYADGKYDEALAAYDMAAKERPADAWIDFNRGAAFFRKGDLDKAKDAWEKAALGATDIPLEAESLYNLGTLEFSRLTEARSADPKAALEAGDRSVRYYHEAKDLLANSPKEANHPLVRDASENIELVRRTMKTIEETLARREEAAKSQAQAAEDLKNLIKDQQDLNQRTVDQAETAPSPEAETPGKTRKDTGNPDPAAMDNLAGEQSRLQAQTQKTAEQLAGGDAVPSSSRTSQAQDPAQAAKDHLSEAQAKQKDAAEKLTAGQASEAAKDQETALENMKTALDLLQYKEDQKSDGQAKKGQEGRKNASEQPANQGQGEQQPASQAAPPDDAQSPREPVSPPDDAEQILGEEMENKKIRLPAGAGGYQDVDKDW